ncbi:ABC transporter [Bradyrhizobium shewense]|nr:ABC transporter [Bradyrhizobium shewense]
MVVMRGLDPRIHPLPNNLPSASMDCRVKPGNDELGQPT